MGKSKSWHPPGGEKIPRSDLLLYQPGYPAEKHRVYFERELMAMPEDKKQIKNKILWLDDFFI